MLIEDKSVTVNTPNLLVHFWLYAALCGLDITCSSLTGHQFDSESFDKETVEFTSIIPTATIVPKIKKLLQNQKLHEPLKVLDLIAFGY